MGIDDYMAALNEEQRRAVMDEGQYTLALGEPGDARILKQPGSGEILAGAGSGKTRVITTKIAWLIAVKGVLPYKILAVTFTKKAANEMRERAILMESRAAEAQIRTFHSWGANFLRRYAERGGLSAGFTVYDDDDMVTLVSHAIPSITRREAAAVAHRIALAKDYGITPESTDFSAAERAGQTELSDGVFLEQYAAYQKKLRGTGNVDFGDLILLPYQMLRADALLCQEMHWRHQFILVDEFQDSNVAQLMLLKQLAGVEESPPANVYVCAVGDEDQSIYRFRGAEVSNIVNFENEFLRTNVIPLVTNYRSTPEILACANSVIGHNATRHKKELRASRPKGKLPTLVFLPNQDDETQFCADLIEGQHKKGVPYADWAILYRTNAQSLGFETDFLRRKIPYTVVGSLKFYEREEVKDALSWLAFLVNGKDEVAFRRIVNKPARGIGGTTQEKIVAAASSAGVPLLEGIASVKLAKKAAEGLRAFSDAVRALTALLPGVPGTVAETELALETGEAAPQSSAASAARQQLSSFIETVIQKSGLEEFHKAQDEVSGTQKLANLQELVNSAVPYPCTRQGLLDFLDSIELDRSLEQQSDDGGGTDRVTLITLHNTKGLEFPRVIITGMEHGVFPRESKAGAELEEERRLFYVGITRAKSELYLTSCAMRRLYGRTEYVQPSPFLSEIGAQNMRVLGQRPALFRADVGAGSGAADDAASHPLARKWRQGAQVYHDDWGSGVIVRADVTDEGEYVVKVRFETGGVKVFMPQYQRSLLLEE